MIKLEVGQIWTCPSYADFLFEITRVTSQNVYANQVRTVSIGIYSSGSIYRNLCLTYLDPFTPGCAIGFPGPYWQLMDGKVKKRKPRKVIPDIPLDPTLPILEAGYIQDRARKRFK